MEPSKTIQSACKCGEPISVELNSRMSCRTDRKRPFYPDHHYSAKVTVCRCRKCNGWISDTCKDAAWGKEIFENGGV